MTYTQDSSLCFSLFGLLQIDGCLNDLKSGLQPIFSGWALLSLSYFSWKPLRKEKSNSFLLISVDLIPPCGICSLGRKISLEGESLTYLGVTDFLELFHCPYEECPYLFHFLWRLNPSSYAYFLWCGICSGILCIINWVVCFLIDEFQKFIIYFGYQSFVR